MKVKCLKCSYEWDYTGKSKYYAQCPMCRVYNSLDKQEAHPYPFYLEQKTASTYEEHKTVSKGDLT